MGSRGSRVLQSGWRVDMLLRESEKGQGTWEGGLGAVRGANTVVQCWHGCMRHGENGAAQCRRCLQAGQIMHEGCTKSAHSPAMSP